MISPDRYIDVNAIFSHVLVSDVKMPHFKGKKENGHFGIGMHIHSSDVSL